MQLISYANRVRLFNAALGTHETDLARFPPDYVAAVTAWQSEIERRKNDG
jgi:hypothetical protein